MSKYMRVEVNFKDEDTLRQALRDVCQGRGIQFEQGQGLGLYGFRGKARPETADYVIRRNFVGRAANDLGFARKADGTFEAVISQFDSRTEGMKILNEIRQRYTRLQVEKLARARGMRVEEVKDTSGAIRLKLYPVAGSRRPVRQVYTKGR